MTSKGFRFLDPCKTMFFLCDVQEKFRPGMPLFGSLVKNVNKLLRAAQVFDIPVIATEQYPEKLGKTDKELELCGVEPIPKTQFSMWVPEVKKQVEKYTSPDIVLFGIETHACVEQTSIDLIQNNLNVYLVSDCTCSRLNQDRNVSIERMRNNGVSITTSEAIIFNLLRDKNHPKFNDIRKIIQEPSDDMKLY